MATKNAGDQFEYTDADGNTFYATVINTYTDEDTAKSMCTLSLLGTEKILKLENNFS